METTHTKFPTPTWDMEIAAERLVFEEAAWNSHEPDKILEGYAGNIESGKNQTNICGDTCHNFANANVFSWTSSKGMFLISFIGPT
jgi:hypothetical protein